VHIYAQIKSGKYAHMRGPTRVLPELTHDLLSSNGVQPSLKLADLRHNLVNVESGFVTEADILLDAIKSRQRVDTANHIAIHVFNAGHRQDRHFEKDAKAGNSGPLPDKP
jgi:hypothetical protein